MEQLERTPKKGGDRGRRVSALWRPLHACAASPKPPSRRSRARSLSPLPLSGRRPATAAPAGATSARPWPTWRAPPARPHPPPALSRPPC
eukprot:6198229-Alexandrium_andersonii.AAC.1